MSSSSKLIAPALCGACRRVIPSSSSTVRARQVMGSHLLRIEGYSLLDRMLAAGTPITSEEFPVGSHRWHLFFFPKGMSTTPHSVSAFLTPETTRRNTVAEYRVSILDRAGDPAYSRAVGPVHFGAYNSDSTGIVNLAGTEELSGAVPRLVGDDDCLNVRCDVTALLLDKEPLPGDDTCETVVN